MHSDMGRFAGMGFFPVDSDIGFEPLPRAEVLERLVNPRGLGADPARLVALVAQTIQSALDEAPILRWEAEEMIRFELPDARVLLALSEGATPGEFGLTLGLAFEGENCDEIAYALARLISCTIRQKFPAFEPIPKDGAFVHDALIDVDLRALLAEPLSYANPGMPPVETLVDQVWKRAAACTDAPPRARKTAQIGPKLVISKTSPVRDLAARLGALRPFGLPQIAPMRQSVRALALMLFAMGALQGPLGQSAAAETSSPETP